MSFVVGIQGINEPQGLRARLLGSHEATVSFGTTQNVDWKIDQMSWVGVNKRSYFNGVQYYAKDAAVGDSLTFQVVDVDGILYPAGTVLEEFGKNYFVMPNHPVEIVLYKARLLVGMYVRVIYKSVGTVDVKFVCNLYRHLDENENS